MELIPGLHMIEDLPAQFGTINVCFIVNQDGTMHMVDSGYAGSSDLIISYLRQNGLDPLKLKTLTITHFDLDHAGSAAELKESTHCRVIAGEFDARIISGERPTIEQLSETFPEYRLPEIEILSKKIEMSTYPKVEVDVVISEEEAEIEDGLRLLHTPGHSPGHLVVYLKEYSAIITGDSLRVVEGRVTIMPDEFTPSPTQANESLKKLAKIDFEILIPYHGKPLVRGAKDALKKYLETVT